MPSLADIQREINSIDSELKSRRSFGMATSDLIERLKILERKEADKLLEERTIDDKSLRIADRKRKY